MTSSTKRARRIEARLHPDTLTLVKRAAEIQGRSLSDFVVAAAETAAMRVIEDQHLLVLAVEDQMRFAELLINPPEPSATLDRARAAHERLIVSS
ncbi:uncharacterized protein (DUF1778 family) [Rhizobium sp. SG_E_25_P2]|uniref:type II toxin-antitoxin system TacA family antitoxin n=1 Tax=Rhizobium sp. SG_E_25_P2 TaxID=2879942 RepID=UPI002473365A|nr:DUF1778 domain-containing protein [Rhizobium sp. SG_E_25_P2]MDH6268299.1 uncharacterized protein (DUF1778 family) [Rhizobium sp. SG_E_25_P2]